MNHERPLINGDGSVSRDFTYVDNVIQVNHLSAIAQDKSSLNQVYNVAHGERTTLNQLFKMIREKASVFDGSIALIEPEYGPFRAGDIPHSLASIEKANKKLGYNPTHTVEQGLTEAVEWYWNNL
jgi:UDP-N-acetylglucosamine 4-epimerase